MPEPDPNHCLNLTPTLSMPQAMATALFVPPAPAEGEEGEAPAEGEEGSAEAKPSVPPPEFIVTLVADAETVKVPL